MTNPGRVAGIDYGTVRIGVAVTDSMRILASPFENYTRRSEQLDVEYFQEFAKSQRIVQFVVGLPVHLNGLESQKSIEAREFGDWLTKITGIAVDYFDERFSSKMAEQELMDAKLTKKRRKARLDKLAAQVMLAGYLESGCQGNDNPGSIDG